VIVGCAAWVRCFEIRGPGDVTCGFAGSFLCVVEQRRGVVLGMEQPRPSDALFLFLRGLL
jgi:hypothetical protein